MFICGAKRFHFSLCRLVIWNHSSGSLTCILCLSGPSSNYSKTSWHDTSRKKIRVIMCKTIIFAICFATQHPTNHKRSNKWQEIEIRQWRDWITDNFCFRRHKAREKVSFFTKAICLPSAKRPPKSPEVLMLVQKRWRSQSGKPNIY